jgi:hypothetical protein
MVESIHAVIAQGMAAYPAAPRRDWVLQWPGQVVLAVTAIFWTQVGRWAISSSAPRSLLWPASRPWELRLGRDVCASRSHKPLSLVAL